MRAIPSPLVKSLHGSALSCCARTHLNKIVISRPPKGNPDALLPPPPTPQTTTLQQGLNGYTGTTDTYLFSANPSVNYGQLPYARAGKAQPVYINRALLKWDLSPITGPISLAQLLLYNSNSSYTTYSGNLDIHVILPGNHPWIEGTKSGTLASPGEPTWSQRKYQQTNWAGSQGCGTFGVDYAGPKIGTAPWVDGTPGWISANLDPTQLDGLRTGLNTGFLLKVENETPVGMFVNWWSAQHPTQSLRPKLIIEWLKP